MSTSLSGRDRPVTSEPKMYAACTSGLDSKNAVTTRSIDFKSRKAMHELYTGGSTLILKPRERRQKPKKLDAYFIFGREFFQLVLGKRMKLGRKLSRA